ncbi:MAG: hypothetical protein NTX82_00385 [Candidatus Parcubacteria bacterium]|nr:hypothetical protein [Candidatus Parcubacteria bacterium]
MDIGSKAGYPAAALSNFAPHPFELDGVSCASMEGFLQSLKFSNPDVQKEVCKLTGLAAKYRGKKRNKAWKKLQTLWWRGKAIDRHGKEYQELLDRAFAALSKNESFRRALLASGKATFTHAIGNTKPSETVLTVREFCSRLILIREQLIKK